jgi:hypothetical protein
MNSLIPFGTKALNVSDRQSITEQRVTFVTGGEWRYPSRQPYGLTSAMVKKVETTELK